MTDEETTQVVKAPRVIEAPAERNFELIADPAQQPRWEGNDNLEEAASGQRVRAVATTPRKLHASLERLAGIAATPTVGEARGKPRAQTRVQHFEYAFDVYFAQGSVRTASLA